MRKAICFAALTFFLCCVFASPGGEFWEKKSYKEWSQKDLAKLLQDSPWSKEFIVAGQGSGGRESTDSQQPYVKYQVQFSSAKPLRQVAVRQQMFARNYDSLPAEKKQELDALADKVLSADVPNVIVVVRYETNNTENDRQLARFWQTQTLDLLKNSVYLIPQKGDKVRLIQFAAAPGAERIFQFVFPREVDGKPIIDPVKDKNIKLEFSYPVIGGMGDGRAFMEFKLDKMVFDGNVAY